MSTFHFMDNFQSWTNGKVISNLQHMIFLLVAHIDKYFSSFFFFPGTGN